MSPLRSSALILGLTLLFTLISPSLSLTCTSQKFSNNNVYANCTDLPYLNSYLHWTYDSSKSSLSIAFVAPPAKSAGWIAWAINPTGTGMVGAQALVALRESNGTLTVKTYNISSYKSIVQSKLSFDVSNATAEYSGNVMRIFATLTLAKNTTTVNQVWQVGSSVTDGHPDKHDFQPANLNAKGILQLTGAQSNSTTGSTNTTTTSTPPTGGGGQSGSARIRFSNIASYILVLFLGVVCF